MIENLTITGLRSHKLFGNNYDDKRYIPLLKTLLIYFITNDVKRINIGMATGSDILAGMCADRINKKNR